MKSKASSVVEYGDFQTPYPLAVEVCKKLKAVGIRPSAIVEPTCGVGGFLLAATSIFGAKPSFYGFEINPEYVDACRSKFANANSVMPRVQVEDFFQMDWKDFFGGLTGQVLVLGNPPWVTNSEIGSLGGTNLPKKANFQGLRGFESKTGKANFDISEWMLIRIVESLRGRQACIAMLCKTAIARKVLRHFWKERRMNFSSDLYRFDAKAHFGASVDACLLVIRLDVECTISSANVFSTLHDEEPSSAFGLVRGELVADIGSYRQVEAIDGMEYRKWWSGVKHDASSIMEFDFESGLLRNGLGEMCAIEHDYVYPLLKSSDVANGRLEPRKRVLLTQRNVSDDTSIIAVRAPRTWHYLLRHAEALDSRRSVIYQKRPRFSVFGVGSYTFCPWKVAVSGLYRSIQFSCVGPHEDKPIMLDDTCYFLPCETEEEAAFFVRLLNSAPAQMFIRSLSFPDNKRPITIDILRRVDLKQIAVQLGIDRDWRSHFGMDASFSGRQSMMVFEGAPAYGKSHSKKQNVPRAARTRVGEGTGKRRDQD